MATQALTKKYSDLAEAIEATVGVELTRLATSTGELGYQVNASSMLDCCRVLRDDEKLRFDTLVDACGIDYLAYGQDEWQTHTASSVGFSRGVLGAKTEAAGQIDLGHTEYEPPMRFAVAYHLLSVTHNFRLRLKVFCEVDEQPVLDSVTSIWNSADWYEREAFDMYGILFRGHKDLRRILTDYGFIGHPFRKDFPVEGNVEVRYDPDKGRVVYEPVSIEPRTLVPKVIRDDNRYESGLKDGDDA